ncbi:hypothetical protein ABT127_19825 [Streptomyces sp. NPDC001904]|uniref:hypothetical protein n=1 Tax=Streptomyces sp. NPDC001904 TaxID=3154531 RepID=UPI00332AFEA5
MPIALGLVLGLLGPVAEHAGGSPGAVVGAVFTGGWPWACYAFLVGYFRRSKIESVVLAPLGLAIGVVTYYSTKGSLASLDGLDSAGAGSSGVALWGVLAFLFGAPVGLVGNFARVQGIGGLFFRLLIPLVAFYETSMRLEMESHGPSQAVLATWTTIRFASVAVAVALVGHTVWGWWSSRRMRAAHVGEKRQVNDAGAENGPGHLVDLDR